MGKIYFCYLQVVLMVLNSAIAQNEALKNLQTSDTKMIERCVKHNHVELFIAIARAQNAVNPLQVNPNWTN